MAYVTTAALKGYLGIFGAADDALLDSLVARTKGIIDRYCHRTFEASADTSRKFDTARDVGGDYDEILFLDEDLAAITSITNGDGTTVTSGQYVTEPRNRTPYYAIRIRASSSVAWVYDSNGDPENAITIAGKWAYSTTAPDDIVHAAVRLAGYLYHQKDNAGELDRAVIAGNATILPVQIPADIKLILAPYRRITK